MTRSSMTQSFRLDRLIVSRARILFHVCFVSSRFFVRRDRVLSFSWWKILKAYMSVTFVFHTVLWMCIFLALFITNFSKLKMHRISVIPSNQFASSRPSPIKWSEKRLKNYKQSKQHEQIAMYSVSFHRFCRD